MGGVVYHVLNRGNGKAQIFDADGDYFAFEKVLGEAQLQVPMRVLSYCIMPNHWHLVLWPHEDGDLSEFMRWLTVTHSKRWQAYRGLAGSGHLYQGRFRSFPVEEDGHFLAVCRYVERNPLRAELVEEAQQWRWCSLWRRQKPRERKAGLLTDWPVPRPPDWLELVNQPQTQQELAALRTSIKRGRPFGRAAWVASSAAILGLESTLRPRGRPRIR